MSAWELLASHFKRNEDGELVEFGREWKSLLPHMLLCKLVMFWGRHKVFCHDMPCQAVMCNVTCFKPLEPQSHFTHAFAVTQLGQGPNSTRSKPIS